MRTPDIRADISVVEHVGRAGSASGARTCQRRSAVS